MKSILESHFHRSEEDQGESERRKGGGSCEHSLLFHLWLRVATSLSEDQRVIQYRTKCERILFQFYNRREKKKEVEQKVEDKEAAEIGDDVRIIEGVGAQVLLNQIRQCAASDALAMDVAMAAAAPIQWLTVAPHHTQAAVATAV